MRSYIVVRSHLLETILAIIAICFLLAPISPARAVPTTWYLSGVTLQGGGSVSGDFTINNCPGSGCITSFDITVSIPTPFPAPPSGHLAVTQVEWISTDRGGPDNPLNSAYLYGVVGINHTIYYPITGNFPEPAFDDYVLALVPTVDLSTTSLSEVPINTTTPIGNFPGTSGIDIAYYDWVSGSQPASLIGDVYIPILTGALTTTPVPEPGSLILLGSGLAGLAGFARKRFFRK